MRTRLSGGVAGEEGKPSPLCRSIRYDVAMRMLRWFGCFLFVFALAAQAVTAEKVAALPKPTGYIDDYASLLSPDARRQMEALCVELHQKTRAQVFVVTVGSLDGVSAEEFANDLFHTWKIGEKKTDRGVLLLFAAKDHKYRIEVGYGVEGILNDAKVGDIGRTMVPTLKVGNYDVAVRTGLNAVVQVIANDANVELTALVPPQPVAPIQSVVVAPPTSPVPESSGLSVGWIFFGLFLLVVLVIFLRRRRAKTDPQSIQPVPGSGTRWQNNTYDQGAGSGLWMSSGDSFSSSGSSSSVDSSSSSDDSFSGGDGGDSGGGGASGDW